MATHGGIRSTSASANPSRSPDDSDQRHDGDRPTRRPSREGPDGDRRRVTAACAVGDRHAEPADRLSDRLAAVRARDRTPRSPCARPPPSGRRTRRETPERALDLPRFVGAIQLGYGEPPGSRSTPAPLRTPRRPSALRLAIAGARCNQRRDLEQQLLGLSQRMIHESRATVSVARGRSPPPVLAGGRGHDGLERPLHLLGHPAQPGVRVRWVMYACRTPQSSGC